MGLLGLYETDPDKFEEARINQVVAIAGDGNLIDGSEASKELREFLSKQESERLISFVDQCLSESFNKSGLVLQDTVNELGRRLDFAVENGLYSGRKGRIGFDGIWQAPNGSQFVIEVKTTDTYRINLDTIVRYRDQLSSNETLSDNASILIVVGREDTGDLEAQVRGSRHAWEVRLISVEALSKLVRLKEEGDEDTAELIRNLLVPREFTRLDSLIDTLFATAEDLRLPPENMVGDGGVVEEEDSGSRSQDRTSAEVLNQKRRAAVRALAKSRKVELLKKSKAQFWSPNKSVRVCCTISKFYEKNSQYWYAYHDTWDDFLAEGEEGYFLVGFVDKDISLAIPHQVIEGVLEMLNVTKRDNGKTYWHIYIAEDEPGKFILKTRPGNEHLDVSEFALSL